MKRVNLQSQEVKKLDLRRCIYVRCRDNDFEYSDY